ARDFVGDEQRAVSAAHVAHAPYDVFLWNQNAEVDTDWLNDERRDVPAFQPLLDLAQCLRIERRGDLAAVRQQVLDAFAVLRRTIPSRNRCISGRASPSGCCRWWT